MRLVALLLCLLSSCVFRMGAPTANWRAQCAEQERAWAAESRDDAQRWVDHWEQDLGYTECRVWHVKDEPATGTNSLN